MGFEPATVFFPTNWIPFWFCLLLPLVSKAFKSYSGGTVEVVVQNMNKTKRPFSIKGWISQKPIIKQRLRIPFHKGLVTLDVYHILSLRWGPNVTFELTFKMSRSLHKQWIVDLRSSHYYALHSYFYSRSLNKKQIVDIRIRADMLWQRKVHQLAVIGQLLVTVI